MIIFTIRLPAIKVSQYQRTGHKACSLLGLFLLGQLFVNVARGTGCLHSSLILNRLFVSRRRRSAAHTIRKENKQAGGKARRGRREAETEGGKKQTSSLVVGALQSTRGSVGFDHRPLVGRRPEQLSRGSGGKGPRTSDEMDPAQAGADPSCSLFE